MKKYLLSLTLSLLFIPIVLWGQNTSAKSLSSRLDTLIKYQLPTGSNVGISVYDLTTGKSLYTYQSDKLSRPASTMKLLTTITALAHPDADEPFKTEVWYQGVIERDTLKGDIYVVGGYDPEFYPASDYAMQAHYTFRYGSVYNCIPTFNYRVAENESLTVYDKFAEVDRHFRNCMKKHIGLPNFVLNRIVKANYNISKIKFAILWGKKDVSLTNKMRFDDKLIIIIVNRLLEFGHYKLEL